MAVTPRGTALRQAGAASAQIRRERPHNRCQAGHAERKSAAAPPVESSTAQRPWFAVPVVRHHQSDQVRATLQCILNNQTGGSVWHGPTKVRARKHSLQGRDCAPAGGPSTQGRCVGRDTARRSNACAGVGAEEPPAELSCGYMYV